MNALFVYGYANWIYLVVLNLMTLYWIYLSIQGFKAEDDQAWAKQYFMFSVKLITVISIIFSFTSTARRIQSYSFKKIEFYSIFLFLLLNK